jgi:hypothetical protein
MNRLSFLSTNAPGLGDRPDDSHDFARSSIVATIDASYATTPGLRSLR